MLLHAPTAFIVLSELEIVALVVHAHGDVADAGPGIEPRAQRPQRAVVRGHRAAGVADCCPEELAALVEHGYSISWSAWSSNVCGIVRPRVVSLFLWKFAVRSSGSRNHSMT